MATWAEAYSARWIVSTGDNFYPNGIRAWDDPAVNIKWRNIYNAYSSLAKLDWKLSVGNHDYGNKQVSHLVIEYEQLRNIQVI
jgi:tartrate-resistant acid phosphatase type 5